MLDWLRRVMIGRYGVDQLTWALVGGYFVCRLVWIPTRWGWLAWMELFFLVIAAYRTLSRNLIRREAENRAFLVLWNKLRTLGWWLQDTTSRFKQRMEQRRTHKIFLCPSCGQKLRVPRGRGKISISCPKCKTQFIRKT